MGAGVTHHICFIPSQSLGDALRDDGSYVEGVAIGTTPAPQKTGEQRRNQTIEEEHMEKERKMLALAETLRAYIPRVTAGERQPNMRNRGSAEASAKKSCTVDDEAEAPLPTNNLASDSLEALEAAVTSAGHQQPPGESASSTGIKLSKDDMPPQCIVFADSQEEVSVFSARRHITNSASPFVGAAPQCKTRCALLVPRCVTSKVTHYWIRGLFLQCIQIWIRKIASVPCRILYREM